MNLHRGDHLPTPIVALDPITSLGVRCAELGCVEHASYSIEDIDGDMDPLCLRHLVVVLWAEIEAQRADLAAFVAAEAREPLRGHTLTPRRRQQIERITRACGCARCWVPSGPSPLDALMRPMHLCSECGNKRCPKATDHRLACSGSNEPGQPGSAY